MWAYFARSRHESLQRLLRRRSEQAIVAVVLEAYVNGVSTRKVDRLVEQLGIEGMSKDRVSALCKALDGQVEAFRSRPLEGDYPYLWLDAKQVKVRDQGHVRSKAVVVAYAVHESGGARGARARHRRGRVGRVLGRVPALARAAGRPALRLRRPRGPEAGDRQGARLPLAALHGPFVRDMLRHCRPSQRGLVSAALREVFNADGRDQARERVGEVLGRFRGNVPKVAELLEDAEEDLIAFLRLPRAALVEAEHQPAQAGQPRDRPPHRRRDLPQRPVGDPARRGASSRTMSGSSAAATCRSSRSRSSSSTRASAKKPRRRCQSSSRPETPTPSPTSAGYTTYALLDYDTVATTPSMA